MEARHCVSSPQQSTSITPYRWATFQLNGSTPLCLLSSTKHVNNSLQLGYFSVGWKYAIVSSLLNKAPQQLLNVGLLSSRMEARHCVPSPHQTTSTTPYRWATFQLDGSTPLWIVAISYSFPFWTCPQLLILWITASSDNV